MKHSKSIALANVRLAAIVAALLLAVASPRALHADQPPTSSGGSSASDPEAAFGMERLFVPRWQLADGPQVRAAFREVVDDARAATVGIHCNGKHVALGGIVHADGWILTKATPLCGKLTCELADDRSLPAKLVGVNREYDLALLKIEATALPTLELADSAAPPVGSWLASVGRSQDPVAVGIVSVAPRAIPAQAGILGVELDPQLSLVVRVFEESAAEAAGIRAGDLIAAVDGNQTPSREKLKEAIAAFNPGDEVSLSIKRGEESIDASATLMGQFPGILMGRSEFQNSLGGKLSVRRFGFPSAFQHDTVLRPVDCGGPLVNVDGHVVGFNIARAGRTESYAIPTSAVQEVIAELMDKRLLVGAQSPATAQSPAPAKSRTVAKPVVEPTP